MVGWSEGVHESAATLTGGHLQVVLTARAAPACRRTSSRQSASTRRRP
jgi:hypothetical protein